MREIRGGGGRGVRSLSSHCVSPSLRFSMEVRGRGVVREIREGGSQITVTSQCVPVTEVLYGGEREVVVVRER